MSSRDIPERPADAQVNQAEWDAFYGRFGHARYRRMVSFFSRLPSEPRCEACGSPFGGLGGRVMRAMGKAPSRKNARWCQMCFENAPGGGATLTIGVLFADVRGSTSLAESTPPEELVEVLNHFYGLCTRVILRHGLVDKLIGDEVMGLYIPALSPSGRFIETMVADAQELLRGIGYGTAGGPFVDVGIGVAVGPAFVGEVGGDGGTSDFTAIGDVVNTASRLQHAARAGQVVMPDEVARDAGVGEGDGDLVELELKGKSGRLRARVLEVG